MKSANHVNSFKNVPSQYQKRRYQISETERLNDWSGYGLRVKCWGATNNGELGNGALLCQVNTICDPKVGIAIPQLVTSVTDARDLDVGSHHSCTITTDSSVKCWGQGSSGQLDNHENRHSNIAVVVSSLYSVDAISL